MADYRQLANKIRSYDTNGKLGSITDEELVRKWKVKYPGRYDDYTGEGGDGGTSVAKPATTASTPAPKPKSTATPPPATSIGKQAVDLIRGVPAGLLRGAGNLADDIGGVVQKVLPESMQSPLWMGEDLRSMGDVVAGNPEQSVPQLPNEPPRPSPTVGARVGSFVGEVAPNVLPAVRGIQAARAIVPATTTARALATSGVGQGVVGAVRRMGQPTATGADVRDEGIKQTVAGVAGDIANTLPMYARVPVNAAIGATAAEPGHRLEGAAMQGGISAVMGRQPIMPAPRPQLGVRAPAPQIDAPTPLEPPAMPMKSAEGNAPAPVVPTMADPATPMSTAAAAPLSNASTNPPTTTTKVRKPRSPRIPKLTTESPIDTTAAAPVTTTPHPVLDAPMPNPKVEQSPVFQPMESLATVPATAKPKAKRKPLSKVTTPEGMIIEEIDAEAAPSPRTAKAKSKRVPGPMSLSRMQPGAEYLEEQSKKKVGSTLLSEGKRLIEDESGSFDARKLWDHLMPNPPTPAPWAGDVTYNGVMGAAEAKRQIAKSKQPGTVDKLLDKFILNPTQKYVSTIRPVQAIQRGIEKATGTVAKPSDRMRNIFDQAKAADDMAEVKLEKAIPTLIKTHTAGMDYDTANATMSNAATYAQALQKRDVEISTYGQAAWEESIKFDRKTGAYTDPARKALDDAAKKGDANAAMQRANQIRIDGINMYGAQLKSNTPGPHYGTPLGEIEAEINEGGKYHGALVDDIQKYNRDMLDELTSEGLISQELNSTLKRIYPNYVPVGRILDNLTSGDGWAATAPIGHLAKQKTVKRLGGGSELAIEDMWETMIGKTFSAQREIHRNRVGRELERVAADPATNAEWDKYVRVADPQDIHAGRFVPDDTNSITYLVDGKPRVLEVDPAIATAARNLTPKQFGVYIDTAKAVGRILRATATGVLNPAFQLSNLARDVFTNVNNTGFRTLLNAPVTAAKVVGDTFGIRSKDLDELRAGGGAFTSVEQFRTRPVPQMGFEIAKSRRGALGKVSAMGSYVLTNKAASMKQAASYIEDLASGSETAARLRVYVTARNAATRKGMSAKEAQIAGLEAARNQLPNYRDMGSEMAMVNSITPYLNAALQGTASTWDALRKDKGRFALRVTGAIVMPQVAATIWNLSSADRQKAYFDTPDYEKDNNIYFAGGDMVDENGKRKAFKVPIPPPFDSITRLTRMGVEKLWRENPDKFQALADEIGIRANFYSSVDPQYDTPRGAKNIAGAVAGAVMPIDSLSDVAPQVFKAGTDAVSGVHQFSGRPFVPRNQENLPKTEQIDKDTSRAVTAAAQAAGVSPAYSQGVITSFGGQGIPMALNAADRVGQAVGILPEGKPGGIDIGDALNARWKEARSGRRKRMDNEAQADAQGKAYSQLTAEIEPAQVELLRSARIPIQPVNPTAGDTDAVIAKRHQLKGRLVSIRLHDLAADPAFTSANEAKRKELITAEIKIINKYLTAVTKQGGRLNPSDREAYWDVKLSRNPK